MTDYRKLFLDNTLAVDGKYRCVKCGKWFPKEKIEVDHRIPKKLGGTDNLDNLQPMCRSCNRRKGDNVTGTEVLTSVFKSAANGTLDDTVKSAVAQNLKNALGVPYKRK